MNTSASRRLISGLHSRGALPHLKKQGGTYFVTFRHADTLPREVFQNLKAEREALIAKSVAAMRPLTWTEQKAVFEWYAEKVDSQLDAGHGHRWLKREEIAELVRDALMFFVSDRYDLHCWGIMPNHVHAVLRPLGNWTLSSILKSWKNFTALKANRVLQRQGNGFWQNESYDHLCRDADDLSNCCAYVINNPVSARLCTKPEQWKWSSAYAAP
jgi:REP element-mobilizing transposase RayT